MDGVFGVVVAAVGMFTGTNVDDLIVLTVLFLAGRAGGKPRAWQVWVGQYCGIGLVVLVSVVAAGGLTVVPDDYVGWLGVVPFGLGVRGLVAAVRGRGGDGDEGAAVAGSLVAVAGVTVANGADNVSVYTPVFRTLGVGSTLVTIAVFAAGVAVWCAAASWLGSHEKVIEIVERYGQWIVPGVFMVIGAVIVIESGVIGRL